MPGGGQSNSCLQCRLESYRRRNPSAITVPTTCIAPSIWISETAWFDF
jgi:hypothetical protein